MYEIAHPYWKRILSTMAERNRSILSEQAYRTLLDALETQTDAHVLRKLAIDTAAVLGLKGGPQRPFNEATFNRVSNAPSLSPTLPMLANPLNTRFDQQENSSPLKPRRRPAPLRP